MAGSIKMPLGREVGLGPSDIVLDRDPAPPPKKGADKAPHFWPMSIVVKRLNGSIWHLACRPHCVRWGPNSPIFGPCLLWPNSWMDQDAIWYGGKPRPRPHCARWGPSSSPEKGTQSPNFRPMYIVAERLNGSRCHLVSWR